MKLFLKAIALTILAGSACAGDFRYNHNDSCTGMGNSVMDAKGVITTISFSKDSDATALHVLRELLRAQIYGSLKPEKCWGVLSDQEIRLSGDFASGVLHSKADPNAAPSEPYRDFKLTGISVAFPFYQVAIAPGGQEIDGPFMMHVHFSFETLLPKGIQKDGVSLDLSKHTLDRTRE